MNKPSFVAACAAAIALFTGAYANSLDNSFHFDDSHVIENNLYLRNLHYVPSYFTDAHTFSSLPQNSTYRPLVTLSLALDYARGGLDPRAYHITQMALMIVTGALLVVFLAPLIGPYGALFAAALFSIHTVNTETMNLISARSELLSTIGLLGSFILYQRSPFARRTLLYLVPLAIGALAKAPVVVFAPLLFAYVMLIEKQPPRRALRAAVPSLILGVALLAVLDRMNAPEWISGSTERWRYLITQPFVWLHYMRLFFLPLGLTADTDWALFDHWYDTRAIAGFAFIALLAVAIRAAARRDATTAFGLAWFAIALLPTSSFFPLAEVSNEHRVFFPYIGLVLAVTSWAMTRHISQNAVTAAAAVVLLSLAIVTHARNEVWKSEETLWADVVAKSPNNGRAWMNYGLTEMRKGDLAGAKRDFQRASTLAPNYSVLEINQGIVEGEMGNDVAAERHFRHALELNADANGHFYYARWLTKRGRTAEALAHVREAVRMSPALAAARELAAQLETTTSNSIRRWANYDEAFNVGLRAISQQDWTTAIDANRDALRHNPNSADAHINLGWSLAQAGFHDEAAREYRQALAIRPNDERAANNLRLLH